MTNNRSVGNQYEDKAAQYLEQKGYQILDRNFRNRNGEIDIVAKSKDTYVFVEVKYRKGDTSGHPLEAVNYPKQRKICQTAMYYIVRRRLPEDASYRFDVIGIEGDGTITHIENAFDFTEY